METRWLWWHSAREKGLFRFWLHGRKRGPLGSLEVSAPSHSWCSIGLTLGDDDDYALSGHIALLRLGVYVNMSARWARCIRHQNWQFAINDGCIRLMCGENPYEWNRSQPWWWSMSIEPARVLFGKMQHSKKLVTRVDSVVPMPEKSYPCIVELYDERWQRPRLPWASRKIRRAHIDIPTGVPVPGKGENSWDCGDDATFGITTPARSVEAGIAAVVESCLRTRRRYGGSVNWQAQV